MNLMIRTLRMCVIVNECSFCGSCICVFVNDMPVNKRCVRLCLHVLRGFVKGKGRE